MKNIVTPLLPIDAKVLLQLSGGKDSIACMILLKRDHIDFEAIHFIHKYGYSLPTQMATNACDKLGVQINIVDITCELENIFLDNFKDRPCRYCKSIMDKITMKFASEHNFSLICVGDSKDDKMLINRLIAFEGAANPISRYFNQKVTLPKKLSIYRPLIDYDSEDILKLVLLRFPEFKRVHDTGDKYFEYSREGCPLQFKDLGAKFTKIMMSKLKRLNTLCSEFASAKGIRASIHLPSEFIVTIPRGYEDDCRHFLIDHGAHLKNTTQKNIESYRFLIDLNLNKYMRKSEIIKIASNRFIERLGIKNMIKFNGRQGQLTDDKIYVNFMLINKTRLFISINSKNFKWHTDYIENVCLEIFHTTNFKVLSYRL